MPSPLYPGRSPFQIYNSWYWRRKLSSATPNGATWETKQEPGTALPLHDVVFSQAVTGIASAEAFGVPTVNQKIYLAGIASAEAFGTVAVTNLVTMYVTGIPSAEAFGTSRVDQKVYVAGIASEEAFGEARDVVPVAGIPSAEAFGVPLVNQKIYVVGIPSAEMFGFLRQTVAVVGIASLEAFGTPSVDATVYVTGIASAEALGRPRVKNFGLLRTAGPTSGTLAGGGSLMLLGAVLDMSSRADDFADGVVGPLWSSLDVGGGATAELGDTQTLWLDTGSVAGAVAGLRSVPTATGLDVEVAMGATVVSLPLGGTLRVASLALRVSTDELRLDLEASRAGLVLRVRATVGGAAYLALETAVAGAALSGEVVLRLVRAGGRVIGFFSGAQVVDVPWLSGAATYEFLVSNDLTLDSRVRARVSRYTRRPLVTFGDVPALDFALLTDGRVTVTSPSVDRPQIVDVVVYGAAFSDSISEAFRYATGQEKVIGRSGAYQLMILNDVTLKEG